MKTCLNHPDRPIKAKGLCHSCYNTKNRKGRKRSDIASYAQRKAYHNRNRYGIEPEQYSQMFFDQEYRCYICGKPHGDTRGTKLHVDHNHATNKVRKLLCNHCNHVVGMIEGPRYLRALNYLKEHK